GRAGPVGGLHPRARQRDPPPSSLERRLTMRLLFVVQRYGHEVAGGAELHCRQFATILAERGHDVEALTSCATSYVDWANFYPAGSAEVDGVLVHRLPVPVPRDDRVFGPLNGR